MHTKPQLRMLCLFGALGLLVGCWTPADMVSRRTEAESTFSADDIRTISVDQPYLVSGDYFRSRSLPSSEMIAEPPPSHAAAGPILEPGVPGDGTQRNENKTPVPATTLKVKVGVLLDRDAPAPLVQTLMLAFEDAVNALPLVPVHSEDLETYLGAVGTPPSEKDVLALAEKAALYPGLRMLVMIDVVEAHPTRANAIRLRVDTIDAALGAAYPPAEFTLATEDAHGRSPAVNAMWQQILDTLLRRQQIMPWHCRAFSRQDETWFINAGRASGLRIDDTLSVIGSGRVVRAPGGLPAGWLPGTEIGRLKIVRLFGRDLAAAILLEGEPPALEQLLVYAPD